MTSFCSQFSGLIFSQLILINCYSGWSYSSCDTISIDRVIELKVMPVTVTHTQKYEWTFNTFRWKTKIQFLLCIYTFCSISAKGVAGTYQIVGNYRKSSNKNRNSAKNNQKPRKLRKTQIKSKFTESCWMRRMRCRSLFVAFCGFFGDCGFFGVYDPFLDFLKISSDDFLSFPAFTR